MPLYTTLASLSTTAASNAADGTVDAPSTIDQQTNLLASFIAELRNRSDPSEASWTSTGVTPTPGSGAFTSANATNRYVQIGKIVHINVTCNVVTNGTAATNIVVPLPVAASASAAYQLAGRANAVSGVAVIGTILAGASSVTLRKYDNTYPGATGETIVVTGIYEAA